MGYEADTISLLEDLSSRYLCYRTALEEAFPWGMELSTDHALEVQSVISKHGFSYAGHGATRLVLIHEDDVVVKIEMAGTEINEESEDGDFLDANKKEAELWMALTSHHPIFNYLITPLLDYFYFQRDMILVYPNIDVSEYKHDDPCLDLGFCQLLSKLLTTALYDVDPFLDPDESSIICSEVSHDAFVISESLIPLCFDFSLAREDALTSSNFFINRITSHKNYKAYVSYMKEILERN